MTLTRSATRGDPPAQDETHQAGTASHQSGADTGAGYVGRVQGKPEGSGPSALSALPCRETWHRPAQGQTDHYRFGALDPNLSRDSPSHAHDWGYPPPVT